MQLPIKSADEMGKIVRASRKAQNIRQDDAAGSMGVSENFLGKVERGSDSVQWGKLFKVLDGLGIRVVLDVPESVADYISQQNKTLDKP
jgi:transcriptional regulator with XRE-family HTH domain